VKQDNDADCSVVIHTVILYQFIVSQPSQCYMLQPTMYSNAHKNHSRALMTPMPQITAFQLTINLSHSVLNSSLTQHDCYTHCLLFYVYHIMTMCMSHQCQ